MTSEGAVINSQDWYRVRRGEDQLAWGKRWATPELPGTVFSERARDEFAFLEPDQQAALTRAVVELNDAPDDVQDRPVPHGQGRRMLEVEALRVVFTRREGVTYVSTIRGGPVLDPEHAGPPPDSEMRWIPA
jgi:hypothetical protein